MDQKPSIINNQLSAEIAIVGGGMVGLAQGIALAEQGISVVVIDREDPSKIVAQDFDGRVSAIAWKSVQLLKDVDAWQYIAPFAQPINDIRVSDNKSSLFTHFDHKEIGDEPFGFIVENRHTRAGLYKRAAQIRKLKLLAPYEIVDVDFKNRVIKTNRAPMTINYQMLIGADGKFSKMRELAGIEVYERSYKQTGIVCTIEHEFSHGGLAHEKFLPAGPFAVLPMQGNRSSLVWTEPTELAHIYMEMSDADFLHEIYKRCDYLGKIKLVNSNQKGCWSYPLSLLHAQKYTAKNFALIGDAAHSIHPIAGQGVNLGFRDVIELTRLIMASRKLGLQAGSALPEYERNRRFDNSMMIAATDILNRLFSNNILPLRLARDMGLGVVNEISPLKRLFMKYASGKR